MSNNWKICCLVQERAVGNCQPCCWSSKLKIFARCQKIFSPSSPYLCCFGAAALLPDLGCDCCSSPALSLGSDVSPSMCWGPHHSWLTSSWFCFCLQHCAPAPQACFRTSDTPLAGHACMDIPKTEQ